MKNLLLPALITFLLSGCAPTEQKARDFEPTAEVPEQPPATLAVVRSKENFAQFKEVYQYALGPMQKSRGDAEKFAKLWLKSFADKDFAQFEEVYQYARGPMQKSRGDAEEFAKLWLKSFADKDFARFKEAYQYALGPMQKSPGDAESFALELLSNK